MDSFAPFAFVVMSEVRLLWLLWSVYSECGDCVFVVLIILCCVTDSTLIFFLNSTFYFNERIQFFALFAHVAH